MKRATILLALAGLLLLSTVALAMSSGNYALDWFTPLTGTGGAASSTHYAADFTVGQAVAGDFTGGSYGACLGYWCGAEAQHQIYLPLILRNSGA